MSVWGLGRLPWRQNPFPTGGRPTSPWRQTHLTLEADPPRPGGRTPPLCRQITFQRPMPHLDADAPTGGRLWRQTSPSAEENDIRFWKHFLSLQSVMSPKRLWWGFNIWPRNYFCDFSFAVNEEDIQCHLEDRQLKDALKDKKLFIVDYRDFDGVQGKENYTVFWLSLETLVISQLKCFVLK